MPFIVAILIAVPAYYFMYFDISKNAMYAIGTTIESKDTSRAKYYFYLGKRKMKGSYTEFGDNIKKIKAPNGKYLVVYSSRNPEYNILLIDKPIIDTINIDSLNAIGVEEDDIDWTKL